MTTATERPEVRIPVQLRGAARTLFERGPQWNEVVISGPAGTGKSRGCLEYLHYLCGRYPGVRAMMARKTRKSLTESAMVTFEQQVLHPQDGVRFRSTEQRYVYAGTGSVIVVCGLDNPGKALSSEYDVIYGQQAEELEENDWETLSTRLRNGALWFQQLVGDVNPQAPTHWLKQRADRGQTMLLESRHEDNPRLWDGNGWTPFGVDYIARLDALTGVRKERLRFGRWAAAEGLVYEGWDRARHIVDRFPVPASWPRIWTVDFGYTNAFVWQNWALDGDGRLFLTRELVRTQTLVEDHAKAIKRLTDHEPRPRALVCDHDAEGRATLERHLGIVTTPAYKAISPGIQAVASRLRHAGNGQPRLFVFRDALVDRDSGMDEAHKPIGLIEEIDAYVWDLAANRKKGEEPVDRDNHSMDCLRYTVAHVDQIATAGVHGTPVAGGARPIVQEVQRRLPVAAPAGRNRIV